MPSGFDVMLFIVDEWIKCLCLFPQRIHADGGTLLLMTDTNNSVNRPHKS